MPAPTDAALDDLAAFIQRTEDDHELRAALEVGARVLDVVFAGSMEAFSSSDPTKDDSLERLSRRTGKNPTWLSNRVRVAEQYPRYDAPYRDQVSLTHHVVLLRAPEIERNQLLRQAVMQELSTRELERLVSTYAGPAPKPEPTPRPTVFQAMVRDGDKLVATAERLAQTDAARAQAMLADVESTEALIRRIKKALKTPPKPKNKK